MSRKDNVISASRVRQNNLEFFVSTFSIKQILQFTKFTSRLIVGYDERNMPIYNDQIQRSVEYSRVEKIADFLIDDPDAIFPTNIVISIPEVVIESYDDLDTKVEITLAEDVFTEVQKDVGHVHLTIIDGQHRIRGIERAIERLRSDIQNLNKVLISSKSTELQTKLESFSASLQKLLNIELMVSFFLDPTLEFQAMIFSTINRTQKSVPQSLVSSLFGLTSNDSPQKSALQIVLSLNGYEKSPFSNRIKLHGGKYANNQSPPLTQANMVKSIIDKISTNMRDAEKDRFRDRKGLLKDISPDLCFRKYYAQNNDEFIADILFAFFAAVQRTFIDNRGKSYWNFENTTKPTNILQTAAGYHALLKLLTEILKIETSDIRRDKVDIYQEYLKKTSKLIFDDQQRYPFTSVSRTILFLDLSLNIWPPKEENDERLVKLDEALKK